MSLRQQLDTAGFNNTHIIIPDGLYENWPEILEQLDTNTSFRDVIYAVGNHYPCNGQRGCICDSLQYLFATEPFPEINNNISMPYWASEDFSTVADWAGGGC